MNGRGYRYQLSTFNPIKGFYVSTEDGQQIDDDQLKNGAYTVDSGNNLNYNQIGSDNNGIWYPERI